MGGMALIFDFDSDPDFDFEEIFEESIPLSQRHCFKPNTFEP